MRLSDPAQSPVEWTSAPDGSLECAVRAVRMSMAMLAARIVSLVVTLGLVAVMILVFLDSAGMPSGRGPVIIISGGIGVLASIGFLLANRARRTYWRIRLDSQSVLVSAGDQSWSLPRSEVRLVRLRRYTDYARIVFVGESTRITLLAALGLAAEPGDTDSSYLPEFSPAVRSLFSEWGLSEVRSTKSPHLTDWVMAGQARTR